MYNLPEGIQDHDLPGYDGFTAEHESPFNTLEEFFDATDL